MKILVSGCSYTQNQTWPSLLFSPLQYDVFNLGRGGAGNEYISNSVTYNIDSKPDFVFILWSGINRTEFRVPNSSLFKTMLDNSYPTTTVGESKYFLSGHAVDPDKGWLAGYNAIKAPSWPEITCLKDWFDLSDDIKAECLENKIYLSTHGGKENSHMFCHQYFVTQHLDNNKQYQSEKTFQNLFNCFNMLEKFNIPYRFSFIYDIFSDYHQQSLGKAVKVKYYNYINWNNYINLTPYEYGIKHDLLSDDNFHLTPIGMNQWGNEISNILKQDKDLQHLF